MIDPGACPCGRGATYAECCGPIHAGARPPTAERAMRARYSAYALGHTGHLLASWHPDTRPAALELDSAQVWVGLEVHGTDGGGLLDRAGFVEFTARYREGRRVVELSEVSRFVRHEGTWVYLEPLEAGLYRDES